MIGCGLITRGAHLPAALSCGGVEVAALVDPVPEHANVLASDYGISPAIARSLDELSVPVDGAIIATPNHTHKDLALACFERGISVLIEKPLANSVAEGEEILAAAQRSGCSLAVGYVSRFRPNVLLLKALLERDYFGRVRRFAHQFGTVGGWSPLSAYNLNRETSGGGVLVVTGTHFLDRMLYLWGYPDDMAFQDDADGGPEANCVATFRFARDAGPIVGTARYSKTTRLPGGLIIETDRGTIVAGDTDSADIVFHPAEAPDLTHTIASDRFGSPEGRDNFAEQIVDFVSACRDGRAPTVSGDQGVRSLRLIEELYARRTPLQSNWYGDAVAVSA